MCSRDMPLVILERSNWRINCRGKNLLKWFPNDPYHGTTLRGSKMGNLLIQWSLTMRRKRNAPLNPTHPVCHVAESPSAPLTQHNPSSLFRDHHPPSPICRRISLASLLTGAGASGKVSQLFGNYLVISWQELRHTISITNLFRTHKYIVKSKFEEIQHP